MTIPLEPNSMVSEQYIARFTDDTSPEFLVASTGWSCSCFISVLHVSLSSSLFCRSLSRPVSAAHTHGEARLVLTRLPVLGAGYDVGSRQVDGMLPRRGTGEDGLPITQEFTVRFHPNGPQTEPKMATLVCLHPHSLPPSPQVRRAVARAALKRQEAHLCACDCVAVPACVQVIDAEDNWKWTYKITGRT